MRATGSYHRAVGWYATQIVPRVVNVACGSKGVRPFRRRVVAGLTGTVVEIGFGSGHNIGLYPPEVTGVLAVEPSLVARRLARGRVAACAVPVEHVGLHGESIPLDDDSCDSALSTFTLCTIPDVAAALAEVRRVLRPGGSFQFLEHGVAPDAEVQRWQRRLEPLQKRMAGGCHLTRDPVALVEAAGFEVRHQEARYAPRAPKTFSWFTVAVAVKPA